MGLIYNYKVDGEIVGVTYSNEELAEINDRYDLGWMFIARDISYEDTDMVFGGIALVTSVIRMNVYAWAKRGLSQMQLHDIIIGGISNTPETVLVATKLDINDAIKGINPNFDLFNDFTALRVDFNIKSSETMCVESNCKSYGCGD